MTTHQLAKRTISAIEKALEEDKCSTAISEIIQIIQEMAEKAFSISIPELSQLIGRDPTITEKVISAANTLGFNPSGTPVSTITEAIHTVGFEKVRNLSISILLLENAGQSLNAHEQREIASMAVCSGFMAQQFAEGVSSWRIDPELAFICSSLRNYGKLLMTTFLIDEYRHARSLALEMENDDEAYKQVFGLTPLELGQYLLKSTQLPKSIMSSLREVPKETLNRVADCEEDEVLVIAELCVKVCETTFNETIEPEKFNDSIQNVLDRFQKSVPVTLDMVNESLVAVNSDLEAFNAALNLKERQSSAATKIRSRIAGDSLPTPPKVAKVRSDKRARKLKPKEREARAESLHNDVINRIVEKTQPGEKADFGKIYNACVNAIRDGLDLESCMVFVEEEYAPGSYSARYGRGELFNKVRNRPIVTTKYKDIFGICLARKEDILIEDTHAGKIASVIPDWITTNSDTSSCVVLPVTCDDKLFAIIFGNVSADRSIRLDENDLRRLKTIRLSLSELKKAVLENKVTEA